MGDVQRSGGVLIGEAGLFPEIVEASSQHQAQRRGRTRSGLPARHYRLPSTAVMGKKFAMTADEPTE
ncbi:hypothetical protein [Streptomyces sp. ST2-7A]|uniref:hypothetical protein n=1 Tax=Streptomyces sp. ST2-7A TaxID=2907214 RepID=UPI001F328973|nr:hypothetical protein [Streptomyces sp. ST2-7A]MCE7079285.1 hypothetical protein [Streptomyces sp. ST2-7A]